MPIVDLEAADATLEHLVDRVMAGEEVVIARAWKPVAKIVALVVEADRPRRKLGLLAGQVKVPPDFDAPLPPDVLDAFEGR